MYCTGPGQLANLPPPKNSNWAKLEKQVVIAKQWYLCGLDSLGNTASGCDRNDKILGCGMGPWVRITPGAEIRKKL